MSQRPLHKKIEEKLWDFICKGGGSNSTVEDLARRIERSARRHIAFEDAQQ